MNCGITFLLGLSALWAGYGYADDSLPGSGYAASRYEVLWTKSPFAVATPEASDQSAEFALVGIYNLDGVDYASLMNKQNNNERYLLTSGKPQNGLSLISITHGEDGNKTFAVIQNKGETLTLKLSDTPPAAPAGNAPQVVNGGMPGQPMFTPQGINPTMYPQAGGGFPSTMAPQAFAAGVPRVPGQPPAPIIRHPIIHIPSSPFQQP